MFSRQPKPNLEAQKEDQMQGVLSPKRLLHIPKWTLVILLVLAAVVGSSVIRSINPPESASTIDNAQVSLSAAWQQSLPQPMAKTQAQANREASLSADQIKRTVDFLEDEFFENLYPSQILYQFVSEISSPQAFTAIGNCYTAVGNTVKVNMPRAKGAPVGSNWGGAGGFSYITPLEMTAKQATFLVFFGAGSSPFLDDKYRTRWSIETTVRGRFADDKPYITSFVSCKRVN